LLKKNGFEVIKCDRLNRDTISAYVRKNKMHDLSSLKHNFNKLNASFRQYVDQVKAQKGTVAIWGASHQGFTILSTAELGEKIDYIIDSAPFKQGKYSPATHIPIISPNYFFEKKADAIIIVAPGYSEEIYRTIKEMYGPDVRIAILRSENLEILK